MAQRYSNAKQNFTSFDEFKEAASKTLNEIYGRTNPFDNFDFTETETEYHAVGSYDSEGLVAVEAGEPVDEEKLLEVEQPTDEEKALAEEKLALQERLGAATEENPVSYADLKRAAELGFFKDGPAEDAKVYTLSQILGASDQAIELAEESNVDIRLVKGTGKNGNIGVGDVREYLKTNPAPEEENANGNGVNDPANA